MVPSVFYSARPEVTDRADRQRSRGTFKPDGVVFYAGPSAIGDHSPVVGILTGLRSGSDNDKTGGMAMLWVLPATCVGAPLPLHKAGTNKGTCGDCPVRPACYAARGPAGWGLSSVGRALARGSYPVVSLTEAAQLLSGMSLRFGAYGEPAALPVPAVAILSAAAVDWTGYTHQWRTCPPELSRYLMASVETPEGYDAAQAAGWRTFRVRPDASAPTFPGEFVCPASAEGGHKVTCVKCRKCNGRRSVARSPVIIAHGSGASFYVRTFGPAHVRPLRVVA